MSKKYQIAQIGAIIDKENVEIFSKNIIKNSEISVFVLPSEESFLESNERVYHIDEFELLNEQKSFDYIVMGSNVLSSKSSKGLLRKVSLLKKKDLTETKIDMSDANDIIEELQSLVVEYMEETQKYKKMADEYKCQAVTATQMYEEIKNAFYWRVLSPVRFITNKIKLTVHNSRAIRLIYKGIKYLIKNGPKKTFAAIRERKVAKKAINSHCSFEISQEQRKKEETTVFDKNIKFSILVPLYNTPKNFLKQMIDSVVDQTYANWELCLADGSTKDFDFVRTYCEELAKNDNRIVYKKLEKNGGISENTNECMRMATGDYIALFDHDDVLHPSVLFENMRVICEQGADYVYTDEATFLGDDITDIVTCHFKADFAPYSLLANNYICHFSVFKRELIDKAGMFRKEYDGSQDHDFILRITDVAEKIVHIPKILYFWRSHKNSVAMDINSKTYAIKAGQNAVRDFLLTKGIKSTVDSSPAFPTIYKVNVELQEKPLVSIIIPTRDHGLDLQRCINSIRLQSTYDNYEIIIVDNCTADKYTLNYFKILEHQKNIKILKYDKEFNYSAINNFAVKHANGKYLLFLNNDTEVITPQWIEELLMYAQLSDVGAVGAKLYFNDDTVQHGGIILGMGADGVAGHSHYKVKRSDLGYMGRMYYVQNLSAVTAACLIMSKEIFDNVGGFSEDMPVAFNDVDLCLKVRKKGYNVLFNPFCELYHYESKSRGMDVNADKIERFKEDVKRFKDKWGEQLEKGDPYFNPNFSLLDSCFRVRND